MKAVVFHKPKDIRVQDWKDPEIEHPRDAIVRVTSTAICGTDLHIFNGLIPQTRPMVLGHEFMGIVEDVGPGVPCLSKGERVIVPAIISCGECWFCLHGLQSHCENSNPKYCSEDGLLDQKAAGVFGFTDLYGGYDGGQAQYVRVPYADYGPRRIPDNLSDEQVLFLTSIMPTGWTAVEWTQMKEGDTVAVFGCGSVGLMAQKAAWLHGASRVFALDVEQYRLDMSKIVANTETMLVNDGEHIQQLRDMTEGRGPDVVIDALGMEARIGGVKKPETESIDALSMAISAVRRGGKISTIGIHGTSCVNFPVDRIFDKGLRLASGTALVHKYMDHLLQLIQEGKIRGDDIITHRFSLDEAPRAYEMLNSKSDGCVKVVMKP